MKAQQRELRKTNRELERDRGGLERQERQLEAEIKKAAKRGDRQAAAVYAKQLVRMRQQKAKSMGLSSTITSTGHRMQVCPITQSVVRFEN
jgi:charged multivesicular body protein 2B